MQGVGVSNYPFDMFLPGQNDFLEILGKLFVLGELGVGNIRVDVLEDFRNSQ